MVRRRTNIPLLNWLSDRTQEGSWLDRWVCWSLKRSIGRLSDKQLSLLVNARP